MEIFTVPSMINQATDFKSSLFLNSKFLNVLKTIGVFRYEIDINPKTAQIQSISTISKGKYWILSLLFLVFVWMHFLYEILVFFSKVSQSSVEQDQAKILNSLLGLSSWWLIEFLTVYIATLFFFKGNQISKFLAKWNTIELEIYNSCKSLLFLDLSAQFVRSFLNTN